MHWERITGSLRAEPMRQAILRALQEAYDENCRRYAPEDLGDNSMTFGVSVSQNLRFLVERELAEIPGIDFLHPRGSFAVRIDSRYDLFFYKAPPGVCDVRSLRFDASKTQLELVTGNAEQLAFDFGGDFSAEDEELTGLACIHFGDPFEGLHRADVGAPVQSPVEGSRWHWAECLTSGELIVPEPALGAAMQEENEDDDFELRLRDADNDQGLSDEATG